MSHLEDFRQTKKNNHIILSNQLFYSNMKKNLLILAAVLLAGLCSCEQEAIPTATVGIAPAASTTVNYDFVSAENNVYTVNVEAKLENGYADEITVSLAAAAEATLESKYYTIAPETATITNGAASFTVTFTSAPADGSYTLPLALSCTGDNAFVDFEADDITLTLAVNEPTPALALTAPSTYAKVDNGYALTYTVATESAYVPADAEYAVAVKVLKGEAELAAGTDYTVTGNATSFAAGKSNTYVVTLVNPAASSKYTVQVGVTTEDFTGASKSAMVFETAKALSKEENAVPGFDRTRPYADVCGNWLNENNNPYVLINGKYQGGTEYWGWNWNKRADGGVRPEDAPYANGAGHPYVFTFDLTSTVDIAQVDLFRSNTNEGNWKSLGAGYIEFSTDRTNWTNKVEFNFTDPTKYPFTNANEGLGPLEVPNAAPVSCKYIRVTLTRNWYCEQKAPGDNTDTGLSAAFAEIDVYLAPALYAAE